jgi:hypothetical protein
MATITQFLGCRHVYRRENTGEGSTPEVRERENINFKEYLVHFIMPSYRM